MSLGGMCGKRFPKLIINNQATFTTFGIYNVITGYSIIHFLLR